jgi:hypothetical protein
MLMMLRERMQQTDAVRSPTAMLVQEGVHLANHLHLRLRDNNNNNRPKSQPEIADSIKKKGADWQREERCRRSSTLSGINTRQQYLADSQCRQSAKYWQASKGLQNT